MPSRGPSFPKCLQVRVGEGASVAPNFFSIFEEDECGKSLYAVPFGEALMGSHVHFGHSAVPPGLLRESLQLGPSPARSCLW